MQKFEYSIDLNKEFKENSIKLDKNVYLMFAEKFDWPNMKGKNYGDRGYCQALKSQIAILSDGTVVPCCLDNNANIKLGNIFQSSLQEILDSTKAKDILNGFKNRKRTEPLCQHCGYSERFSLKK